ncbi:hypothetical protein [Hoyosella altamirensis]|uniref:Uncharacterized protein n=1 Tax=Hoyosella altamirensis TaxID=616997 RepID=A0A839RU89_9ACTN|nr:hypothetical protein [Hoyosella altamirensis]MBB3039634.1 hypothetical protein [Hoyosella altamirensis]
MVKTDETRRADRWPGLLRVPAHLVFVGAILVVAGAWFTVYAVDIWGWGGRSENLLPMWWELFNDGIVEVAQWIYIALFVVGAGYLAGRLRGGPHAGFASFFFVMSIGFAFILIEEAGDVRLILAEALGRWLGYEILGMHFHVIGTLPVMMFLAFFPLYALVRYAKHVWRAPRSRAYLIALYGLYAVSQLGAQTSHIEGWYAHFGNWINSVFFDWRLPVMPGIDPGANSYFIIDNVVEESFEMLAAGALLALLLAAVADIRAGIVPPENAAPEPSNESGVQAVTDDLPQPQ